MNGFLLINRNGCMTRYARVLLALRAGTHDNQQLRNRLGDAADAVGRLARIGLVRAIHDGSDVFYSLTPAGRQAADSARQYLSHWLPPVHARQAMPVLRVFGTGVVA
ncbi:hypothetical protein [Laribacter hongkongensis]|uniref:Transcriptional regulator n=1 Tax=Laribacter hongkongensis TaxID=168471 RepID=A0ABD4SUY4_9NEIS|nr:hypothetical protein [Laribacter hongkongensis]MCG9027042.1 hypothetical protein [Laribacter hongkongensis]